MCSKNLQLGILGALSLKPRSFPAKTWKACKASNLWRNSSSESELYTSTFAGLEDELDLMLVVVLADSHMF